MITHVTVLEDRAQVKRTQTVKLEKGSTRVRIDSTPLIHDRSLLARSSAGRVLETRCVRKWLIGNSEQSADHKTLADAELALSKERQQWERTQAALVYERAQLTQTLQYGTDGITRELSYVTALPDSLTKTIPEVMERQRKLDLELWDARRALSSVNERAATLAAQRAQLARPQYALNAVIEVDIEAEAAGEATLTVEYIVPCAAWRPMHRARLTDSGVLFETEAAVWQATGEAWDDVTLQFSTARSTQRAEPPLLADDLIYVQDRQSKEVVAQVRAQRIQTTGQGMTIEPEVPGVDDGGESRLLGAAQKATVVSSGKMHRVPLLSWKTECTAERTARPELSPLVYLLSRQRNTSSQPILPGPVELVRDSGVVGSTSVLFVGAGETFVLNWGADDAYRINRVPWETRDTARLTGKLTIERSVTLYLSNLADVAGEFQVEERVPVSELAQVDVKLDDKETKPLKRPDENGIVRWQVSMPPHSTETIALRYSLIASSDVRGL